MSRSRTLMYDMQHNQIGIQSISDHTYINILMQFGWKYINILIL
jgi:hypothetical protein